MALNESVAGSVNFVFRSWELHLSSTEVHAGLIEKEKMKVCCVLNFEKLASNSCKHLAQNQRFPSKAAVQALISQQCKLKSFLQDADHLKPFGDLQVQKAKKDIDSDQISLPRGLIYQQKMRVMECNGDL